MLTATQNPGQLVFASTFQSSSKGSEQFSVSDRYLLLATDMHSALLMYVFIIQIIVQKFMLCMYTTLFLISANFQFNSSFSSRIIIFSLFLYLMPCLLLLYLFSFFISFPASPLSCYAYFLSTVGLQPFTDSVTEALLSTIQNNNI